MRLLSRWTKLSSTSALQVPPILGAPGSENAESHLKGVVTENEDLMEVSGAHGGRSPKEAIAAIEELILSDPELVALIRRAADEVVGPLMTNDEFSVWME